MGRNITFPSLNNIHHAEATGYFSSNRGEGRRRGGGGGGGGRGGVRKRITVKMQQHRREAERNFM